MNNKQLIQQRGRYVMKRKTSLYITASMIVIVLLLVSLPKLLQPDETLQVGHQVGEFTYEYTDEIKEKEKIVEYEKWFDGIEFTEEGDEPKALDEFADIIVQVRRYNEGTSTHPVSIWIGEDEAIIVNGIGYEYGAGRLSLAELEDLYGILN